MIGVVVGVGGFLVLCGAAFVVYRVWLRDGSGRAKRYSDKDDDPFAVAGGPSVVGNNVGAGHAKAHGRFSDDDGSEANVFRNNLDASHAPSRPNAASNF